MAVGKTGPLIIALTGPESSGKTTLALDLSAHWNAGYVPEYAREYLSARNGNYTEPDLPEIASGQLALQKNCTADICICDTDLLVITIWSEWKFGRCDSRILEALLNQPARLYILCMPDFPWQYDPLREHPQHRHLLYDVYKNKLEDLKLPYIEVGGSHKARFEKSNAAIYSLIEK